MHDAFVGGARRAGRVTACRPIRARGSSRRDASRRSTGCGERARFDAALAGRRTAARRRRDASIAGQPRTSTTRRRGRPPSADLHLLPSRRSAADAQVALTLREVCGLTTEEIARAFLTLAADAGAAHRAREGEDPRREDPVSGAVARRSARAARRGAARHLSGLQRRLLGVVGRLADPPRPVRRGDPARAAAGRAAAGAGGASGCSR